MSETVACGLEKINCKGTEQTRLFIRMIDRFFDCLNIKGPLLYKLKKKDSLKPYTSPEDEKFKVAS